jgi:hypothetical protein
VIGAVSTNWQDDNNSILLRRSGSVTGRIAVGLVAAVLIAAPTVGTVSIIEGSQAQQTVAPSPTLGSIPNLASVPNGNRAVSNVLLSSPLEFPPLSPSSATSFPKAALQSTVKPTPISRSTATPTLSRAGLLRERSHLSTLPETTIAPFQFRFLSLAFGTCCERSHDRASEKNQ